VKPYYDDGRGIVIYNCDCREVLPTLPPVDLVLTDPPFSVPVKYHDAAGDYPRGWGDLVVMEPFFVDVFQKIRRATKETGQVYICCDANTYPVFFKAAYPIWPKSHLIVWYKPTGRRGGGWKHSHELILHLATGKTAYSDAFNQDVIGIMPVRTLEREHPAEKPGELMEFLAEAYPITRATVALDPFMGSGTTLVMAKKLRCRGVGIDIEEWACEAAAKRLEQEVLDFGPPPPAGPIQEALL
jgi:site-specific DNA-methyltransferase (adenine-specific)